MFQSPRAESQDGGGKLQITWDNPKELEIYINKLQNAAERLSTQNRKLRKWHTDFTEKVKNIGSSYPNLKLVSYEALKINLTQKLEYFV